MPWIFLLGLLDLIDYLPCGYKLVTSFIQGIYTSYKNANKIQVDKIEVELIQMALRQFFFS